jgi:hypothetical protein
MDWLDGTSELRRDRLSHSRLTHDTPAGAEAIFNYVHESMGIL